MELTRLKCLLAMVGGVMVVAATLSLLLGAALLVVQTGTGADPNDAFTPTSVVPSSLRGKVTWAPDAVGLDRAMEPPTRTALEAAWLRSAAQRELEASHLITAGSHQLQVSFYSLDGQVAQLNGTSQVRTSIGDQAVGLAETYEAILILTDGRWVVDQLVRTSAILTEA